MSLFQLHLDRSSFTILRNLDQDHHQERDDGNNKLPCVRETEQQTRNCAKRHGCRSQSEHPRSADIWEPTFATDSLLKTPGFNVRALEFGVWQPFCLSEVTGTEPIQSV